METESKSATDLDLGVVPGLERATDSMVVMGSLTGFAKVSWVVKTKAGWTDLAQARRRVKAMTIGWPMGRG
jgi:hypothetical protein